MDLDPEVAAFAGALHRLEQHLARHGATWWATEISRCRLSVEKSDGLGLRRFPGMLGGMGSLNDLVLQPGGRVLVAENHELDALLGEAWTPGKKLECDLEN